MHRRSRCTHCGVSLVRSLDICHSVEASTVDYTYKLIFTIVRRRRVTTATQPDSPQTPPIINSNSSRLSSRRSDSNARPFLIAVIATIRRFTSSCVWRPFSALRTPLPRAPADHHHRAVREQHSSHRHPCFSPGPVSPVSNGPSAPYSSPPPNSQTTRVWSSVRSDTIGKLTQEEWCI